MIKKLVIFFVVGLVIMSGSLVYAKKVELTLWCHGFEPHKLGWESVINAFNKYYPDIQIKLQPKAQIPVKIKTAIAAGQAPDMFTPGGYDLPELILSKSIAPYPDDVLTVKELKKKFWPEYYLQAPFDKVYAIGIPDPLGDAGVLVNLDMFEEAGLEQIPAFESMDQLIRYGKKLTKVDSQGNMLRAGFNARETNNHVYFWGFIADQGGRFYDNATGLFNYKTEEARKALTFFYDVYYTYNMDSVKLPIAFNALAQKLAAMAFMWGEYIPFSHLTYPELNFGFILKPSFVEGAKPNIAHVDTWDICVAESSKNKDAAFKFIKYMTTPEAQLLFMAQNPGISSLKELADPKYFSDENKWVIPMLELLPNTKVWGFFGHDRIIKDMMIRTLSEVIHKEISIEEGLDILTRRSDEEVKSFRKKYPDAPIAEIKW